MDVGATTARPDLVTGLFRVREKAELAYQRVLARGYSESDINVMMTDETRRKHYTPARTPGGEALAAKATQVAEKPEGETLGGPVGGTVGTLAPAVAAVGTLLLVPGIIFAGPVAIALAAAGAVGLAGGVVGALTNWGIPNERVREYESAVRAGGILLGVKPKSRDEADELRREWSELGGEWVHA
jgi:hypothetical protein